MAGSGSPQHSAPGRFGANRLRVLADISSHSSLPRGSRGESCSNRFGPTTTAMSCAIQELQESSSLT